MWVINRMLPPWLSRNLCDALPSSLSNLAAHYDYFCVHEAAKVMLSSPRPLGYCL